MKGWLRQDNRKGIRNYVAVAYLVECAHHVAREIAWPHRDAGVHLIGFPGCYSNDYAYDMMSKLLTHPNVGAVLLISLGCEGFNRNNLKSHIEQSGRPVDMLVIQECGGTQKTIDKGQAIVRKLKTTLDLQQTVKLEFSDLIVGTICGGSDATSGITANPSVGFAFDKLIEAGGIGLFEETGELIGCEDHMSSRAITTELGQEIKSAVKKAERYYRTLGQGSFAPGNAEGGLTTQEEKSMGAYAKSGNSSIMGLIKPGDIPFEKGLYLLDVVPDGEVRFGFPNIADTAEIVELIACGAQLILFTTGRGSVVGSALAPVIKIAANPEMYDRLPDDMDINAGRILTQAASIAEIGTEIFSMIENIASGASTKSEALGHQEFLLTYKSFDPIGPACLPRR